MNAPLVIFDCDGVLVDSEPLSIGLMMDHCRASGFDISEKDAYAAFLGKPVADAADAVRTLFDREIAPIDLQHFQAKVLEAFEKDLLPVEGIGPALETLNLPKCVASSSSMSRIRFSLSLTGLEPRFGKALFSTDLVARGKPHPDIFLYAADRMGANPKNAIVVEDSPAGIRGAQAAGMRVIGFTGGSHGVPANLADRLAMLKPDLLIDDMAELKHAIERLIGSTI